VLRVKDRKRCKARQQRGRQVRCAVALVAPRRGIFPDSNNDLLRGIRHLLQRARNAQDPLATVGGRGRKRERQRRRVRGCDCVYDCSCERLYTLVKPQWSQDSTQNKALRTAARCLSRVLGTQLLLRHASTYIAGDQLRLKLRLKFRKFKHSWSRCSHCQTHSRTCPGLAYPLE